MWGDMYNVVDVSTTSEDSSYTSDSLDSKYTVADILSSMATGSAAATPLTFSSHSPVNVSHATPTSTMTSTTTLGEFGPSSPFTKLHALPSAVVRATERSRREQMYRESGFVPPIVSPISGALPIVKSEPLQSSYFGHGPLPDCVEPALKRQRTDGPLGQLTYDGLHSTTAPRHDSLYHKEDQFDVTDVSRRVVRRERNKLAAAKCRQRRVDHTNVLVLETEDLEEKQGELESEIRRLQRQRDQLEFLLEAHKPLCHANDGRPVTGVKTERADGERSCRPSSLHLPAAAARPAAERRVAAASPPSVLAESVMGVAIDTPSAGLNLCALGLDSMMNGHTGLTPITCSPMCVTTSHGGLTTPVSGLTPSTTQGGLMTPMLGLTPTCATTSCATQAQRSSSDSSPDSLNSSTTLMAL